MARKLSIVVLCLLVVLLIADTNAKTDASPIGASTLATSPASSSMNGTTEGSLEPKDCAPRCDERCSKTHHKKPCLFFCNKCCAVCLCVPPGTSGNKELCPCYNNWKTKRGGPKCP